jgi:Tol biopolymer transport system component
MTPSKVIFIGLLALVSQLSAFTDANADADQKISANLFFQNPVMNKVTLSPNGQFTGILTTNKNGRVQLVVVELQPKKLKVVGGFSNADIDHFYWVNDERLVFTTNDRSLADGENEYFPGLYAVNRDGSEFRTLIDRVWSQASTTGTIIKKRVISADNYFYSLDPKDGTDSVFIVEPIRDIEYSAEAFNLLKLNTKTGLIERFDRPGKTVDWLIDQNGIPRINITSENGLGKIFYLDDSQGKWTQLAEFNSVFGNAFTPYEFGPDGVFYVVSSKNNKNSGLYRFDLKNKRIEDNPIISIKGFDFSGELIFDRH